MVGAEISSLWNSTLDTFMVFPHLALFTEQSDPRKWEFGQGREGHGWEHKISKSRQTQATGGKNCEKAGKLRRLCGDIIQ